MTNISNRIRPYLRILLLGLWLCLCLTTAWADDTVTTQIEYNQFEQWNETDRELSFSKAFPQPQWWLQFHDPILNGYIEEALKANQNLRIAELRIQEARELARMAWGAELPTLGLHSSFLRQRNSKGVVSPSQSQFAGAGPRIFAPGQAYNIFNLPLQASYEVDFLGKNRDKTHAAQKQTDVSTQEYRTAFLVLTAEVAGAYLNLVKVDKLSALETQRLHVQQEALSLQDSLRKAGLISETSLLSKKQALAQTQINLLQLQNQKALFAHQLSLLRGRPPETAETLKRSALAEIALDTTVMAGLPSQVVTHRPDIVAAEAQLEKAKLDIRVARKAFFPTFTLTGQYGFAATQLHQLFQGGSYLAAVGAGLSQSLFEGGQKVADYRLAKVRYESRIHQYQQAILQAFQEVEDSLASLKAHYGAVRQSEEALALAKLKQDLTQSRYQQGIDAYLDVLQAQDETVTLEQQAVQQKAHVLVDTISLYKAIGGGL